MRLSRLGCADRQPKLIGAPGHTEYQLADGSRVMMCDAISGCATQRPTRHTGLRRPGQCAATYRVHRAPDHPPTSFHVLDYQFDILCSAPWSTYYRYICMCVR